MAAELDCSAAETDMRITFCVLLILAGCHDVRHRASTAPSPSVTEGSTRSRHEDNTPSKVETLGDQIAGLSVADATALSEYLEVVHGIIPSGATPRKPDDAGMKKEFSEKIRNLGKAIVGLSLNEATQLSKYIAEKYGIQPARMIPE